MKTAILLSYKGLGSNLLHLAYCHEIAKKVGPVTIITLCKNLEQAISKDPLIKEVIYLEKYHKKFIDIFNLSKFLNKYSFDNIYIFYPSLRFLISCKVAGIKNIYCYPIFNKRNLHLVTAAKKFTEKSLNIENCPTETNLYIDPLIRDELLKKINPNKKNIVLGVGSSGTTTRWGAKNFTSLINQLNKNNKYFFHLLCGPHESEISTEILHKIGKENCASLSDMNISEVVPLISVCDLYIGNDSFGQHVAAQCQLPSFILIFDTPKAYSDYSKNQFRILPKDTNENDISHDSAYPANSISVGMVLDKIKNFIK